MLSTTSVGLTNDHHELEQSISTFLKELKDIRSLNILTPVTLQQNVSPTFCFGVCVTLTSPQMAEPTWPLCSPLEQLRFNKLKLRYVHVKISTSKLGNSSYRETSVMFVKIGSRNTRFVHEKKLLVDITLTSEFSQKITLQLLQPPLRPAGPFHSFYITFTFIFTFIRRDSQYHIHSYSDGDGCCARCRAAHQDVQE